MPQGQEGVLDKEDGAVNGAFAAQGSVEKQVATSDRFDQNVDEKHRVLDCLLAAHEIWFNVTRDYEYAGRCFEGYAEFHSLGEKYVLTKKAKLWEVEAHEYLFFATIDELDKVTFAEFSEFMKNEAVNKVVAGPNHMSSYLSLVLIADKMTPDAGKALKKTAYHKSFKFGFQGWAEFRFCAVDLSARQVITNAMGKKMKSTLEESAGFVASDERKMFIRR